MHVEEGCAAAALGGKDALKFGFCVNPVRFAVACRAGEGAEVERTSDSRLAADRIVGTVVEEEVPEAARPPLANGGQRAEVHKRRAVPVQAAYRCAGAGEGKAERDARRVPH